jgi:hypothetical protein
VRSTLAALALGICLTVSACGGDDDGDGGGDGKKPAATPSKSEIDTSAGRMVVSKVETGDRYPVDCAETDTSCQVAEPGYKVLIVKLKPKDGRNPVESKEKPVGFKNAYIQAPGGERTEPFLDGADRSDFLVGFTPREEERDFKLYWKGNPPVDLPE